MRVSASKLPIKIFLGLSILCFSACGTNTPGAETATNDVDTSVVDEGNDATTGGIDVIIFKKSGIIETNSKFFGSLKKSPAVLTKFPIIS